MAAEIGVSIHAPAWGATAACSQAARSHLRFQSTRPRGARRIAVPIPRRRGRVSIHAPAWGATDAWARWTEKVFGFNPRARVGRDFPVPQGAAAARVFNPR